MGIGFENLDSHVISLDSYRLKWRFTEPQYNQLPAVHLNQLKPLHDAGARFLWDFIINTRLHSDCPFKKDFFKVVDEIRISEGNESEIKKWLYRRGIPFEKQVYLSWQPDTAMIVPWKLVVKYFDDFAYPVADDLTIIDSSLNWALLFFHEGEIYFGSNEGYEPMQIDKSEDFI